MHKPTAIYAANRGFGLASSRMRLMQHFVDQGWRVVAATVPDEHTERLRSVGVEIAAVPFARGGFSPVRDVAALRALRRLYRREKPSLVHHFNAKPVLFGGWAASGVPGVRSFQTITGLGHAFMQPGVARVMASLAYEAFLRHSDAVIFQNSEDKALFQRKRWIDEDRAKLIVGSGVDTNRFRPRPATATNAPRVLMVGRLIWQKGVREFVEAAARLRQVFPQARFQLAGEWDSKHPDAVPQRYVDDVVSQGHIEFLGYLRRLEEVLPEIDVFVLPSYREGAPRVVMEAAACGVPVVSTDAPGCRDVVSDGHTGSIVPVQNVDALVNAVAALLKDPVKRARFGARSRQLMVERFDIRAITEAYLETYRAAGVDVGRQGAAESRTTPQRAA